MHYAVYIISIIILIIIGITYRQLRLKLMPDIGNTQDYALIFLVYVYLLAFAVFRSEVVGNDTLAYIDIFKSVAASKDFPEYSNRYEYGYLIYNKLCSLISKNPQTVIIITGIITTTCYIIFINRYSKSIAISLLLFIFLRFYDDTLNVLRQCLAMCVIFYSFKYLSNRNFLKFCICIILAYLFHKTSIVFITAWWITSMKLNKRNILIFSIVAIVLSVQFGLVFQEALAIFETYSYYADGIYFGDTRFATIINLIIQSLLFAIAYTIYNINESRVSRNDEIMLMLWLTGICILIVSTQFNLFDRIATYFNVFSIIALPNMLVKIKNRSNRVIIETSILILLLSYYVVILEYRPLWNRIFPYEIASDL